jgi:crossover junction endodeoxyribonuclease RusA
MQTQIADPDPFGSDQLVKAPEKPALFPVKPGEPIRVTLPYPPSANRYWRTRVIASAAGGGYTFAGLLKDALQGSTNRAKLVATKVLEPFVSTYVSGEAKTYKEHVGWLLVGAGVRKPLAGRVHVHLELWPHRPLDWAKRAKADPLYWADTVQRLDLDNCRKVVTDALKGIAIEDDRQVWKDSGEVMEPDGRDACLIVTITPLVKFNPQKELL